MRVRAFRGRPLASYGLAVLVAGCISGGRIKSGVDPTKLLSDVTTDEQITFCRADVRYHYQVSSGTLRCKAVAVDVASGTTDAELRASCEAAFDTCRGEGVPGQNQDAEQQACNDSVGEWKPYFACSRATIADLELCASDQQDTFSVQLNELSACNSLTLDELATYRSAISRQAVPTCQDLDASCFE